MGFFSSCAIILSGWHSRCLFLAQINIMRGMRTLTIKDIPDEVLRRFRAFCALSGKSMNEVLVDYMRREGARVTLEDESENVSEK